MFKDTQEGQTHYKNDGCGIAEHNKPQNNSAEWKKSFDEKFGIGLQGAMYEDDWIGVAIKDFINTLLSRETEKSRQKEREACNTSMADTIEFSKMGWVEQGKEEERKRIMQVIDGYLEHFEDCVCLTMSAGRTATDGGYEQKFGKRWYQRTPIDETPKCNCGLSEIISALKNKQ